jgi:hypothetical protein
VTGLKPQVVKSGVLNWGNPSEPSLKVYKFVQAKKRERERKQRW